MSNSETEDYVDFNLYTKDIQAARKEIEEFEKILNKAKQTYKEKYNEDYDSTWYSYITHIFNWFNPLNYIKYSEYYNTSDKDTYKKGYDMYNSVYDGFSEDEYSDEPQSDNDL